MPSSIDEHCVLPPFVNNAATGIVGKISFDSRSPGVLELSKDRAQEPYMDEPCVWKGQCEHSECPSGVGWGERTLSWAWGGVSMFEREGPEGREMPDFIFLILCPAQVLIVHFVDQTLEFLARSLEVTCKLQHCTNCFRRGLYHHQDSLSLSLLSRHPQQHQQPTRRVWPPSSAVT